MSIEEIKKYKYGTLTDNNDFHKINKTLNFEECIKAAQTGGAICNPGGKEKFCQFMGFKEYMNNDGKGICYIGNGNIDDKFDGKTGISVYLTPLEGKEDIKMREIKGIERMKKKLIEQKNLLNNRLERMNILIKAMNENRTYNDVKKEMIENKKNMKLNRLYMDKNERYKNINKIAKNLEKENNLLVKLLGEKDKNMIDNFSELNNLDKKLSTLKTKISINNDSFSMNQKITHLLYISVPILITFIIFIMVYYYL